MVKRDLITEVKPIEDWTVEDWKKAYEVLNQKHDKLRECMRKALVWLNQAV